MRSTRVEAVPGEQGLARGLYGIFVVAALVNLGGKLLLDSGATLPLSLWLVRLSKPLLIPTLAGLFAVRARGREVGLHRGALYAALLCCWVGDLFLMFEGFFLPGMGAFALAQLFFIASYSRGLSRRALLQPDTLSFVLPIVAAGYLVYLTIYFSLSEAQAGMALPLGGYMVLLLANGTTCLFRARQRLRGGAHVLLGLVLLILSDSLLGMTRYVKALPHGGFAIMLTYIVGTYWMVLGSLADEPGPSRAPGP